jgi:hypothetical protein
LILLFFSPYLSVFVVTCVVASVVCTHYLIMSINACMYDVCGLM